jgi:GH24 family phage-related lysozyme (muramidase)
MNISQNGVDFIAKFEGFVDHAYKPVDEERYYTLGFGHYGPDVKPGQKITKAAAEELLKKDLANYVADVNSLVKVQLNQNQFDALTSFCFNCGYGNLASSTLLKKVNIKDFAGAAKEFDKWVHGANKQVLPGLVNRRNAEQALFLKPVPAPPKPARKTHKIVKGDTLYKIAAANHTTVDHLQKLNPKVKPTALQIGAVLYLS